MLYLYTSLLCSWSLIELVVLEVNKKRLFDRSKIELVVYYLNEKSLKKEKKKKKTKKKLKKKKVFINKTY